MSISLNILSLLKYIMHFIRSYNCIPLNSLSIVYFYYLLCNRPKVSFIYNYYCNLRNRSICHITYLLVFCTYWHITYVCASCNGFFLFLYNIIFNFIFCIKSKNISNLQIQIIRSYR